LSKSFGYASLSEVPAKPWWHRIVILVKHLAEDGLRPCAFLRPELVDAAQ